MVAGGWPFWVFIAVLILLHFVLRLGLDLGQTGPDLLVPAVLLGARRLSGGRAAVLGFAAGVLQDALALVGFGASAILLTVLAFLGARTRDLFFGDSLLFIGLYLFAGTWVFNAARLLMAGAGMRADPLHQLLVQAPLAALYSAAAGVIALLLYRVVVGDR